MLTQKFDSTKLSTYVLARIGSDRLWFEVSHFSKFEDGTGWHVWLKAAHGIGSGFVSCRDVIEWETNNIA